MLSQRQTNHSNLYIFSLHLPHHHQPTTTYNNNNTHQIHHPPQPPPPATTTTLRTHHVQRLRLRQRLRAYVCVRLRACVCVRACVYVRARACVCVCASVVLVVVAVIDIDNAFDVRAHSLSMYRYQKCDHGSPPRHSPLCTRTTIRMRSDPIRIRIRIHSALRDGPLGWSAAAAAAYRSNNSNRPPAIDAG